MNILKQNRGQGVLMMARTLAEAASAFFITAALLNYGATSTAVGRELIRLQPEVAVAALSLSVLAIWTGITVIFGRLYCSTLCPLGALMDLGARARLDSRPYRWSKPLNALRIGVLIAALPVAVLWVAPREWILPFGLYSTIETHIIHPRIGIATLLSVAVAIGLLVAGFKRGRLVCNTLCPVGTLLGLMARRSAFHIDINTDRCTQCRRCVDACKGECINLEEHTVDMSRCVLCFNCLPPCPNEAITYTLSRHTLSDPLLQNQ